MISEALYELENHAQIPDDKFCIITVSAAVAMPRRYKKIIDVMGTIDGFGALNSTPGIFNREKLPPELASYEYGYVLSLAGDESLQGAQVGAKASPSSQGLGRREDWAEGVIRRAA